MEKIVLKGRGITSGTAEATAIVSRQPFGFSHGIDPATGRISDEMHEWLGQSARGMVLVFPYGKGSSSGGMYILESARLGNLPAAIINVETDPVIAGGCILAKIVYGRDIPVVDKLERDPCQIIRTGDLVKVNADAGTVEISRG